MSKKKSNDSKERIDEPDDESKIDWSGLGDAVEKEYYELHQETWFAHRR